MKEMLFFLGSLSTGGAERAVSNISLNLDSDINKKIILFNEKLDYPYDGKLIILKKASQRNIFNKFLNFVYRYNQVKKIKIEHNNVPLISFLDYPNLINILTSRYGTTILSVRNHMSSKHKNGVKAFF